jgi:hypothetical protein
MKRISFRYSRDAVSLSNPRENDPLLPAGCPLVQVGGDGRTAADGLSVEQLSTSAEVRILDKFFLQG